MENKELVVLSLFDGMSCCQQALERQNIKVGTYYASEIDKYAIQVTQKNYPDTIQLGSVVNVDVSQLKRIDILAGGSPCQSFSFAGKRKGMSTKDSVEILTLEHYLELKSKGFEFEGQSYLFWEYMRILTDIRKINPDVKFLLENVMMGEKWQKVLTQAIGINPIEINSALVSAQNRRRLFWTNIGAEQDGLFGDLKCMIKQPKDKGILLKDVLEREVDKKYYLSEKMIECLSNRKKTETFTPCKFIPIEHPFNEKSRTINQRLSKMGDADNYIKIDKQLNIKLNQDKAGCFTAGGNSGGNHSDMDLIVHNMMPRSGDPTKGGTGHLTRTDGKTYCLDTGNTNAVEIVAMRGCGEKGNIEQQLEANGTDKSNSLTTVQKDNLVSGNSRIRRLTPVECERLQTVKDFYTNYGLTEKTLISCQQNVQLSTASQELQIKKLNSAINTTLDLSEAEQQKQDEKQLLIDQTVKWSIVKESKNQSMVYASCTIKDGLDLEQQNCLQKNLIGIKNVRVVIKKLENLGQKECVQNIFRCGEYIKIHYILKKKEQNQSQMDILDIQVELECTELLCQNILEELSNHTRKFIILIWIERIMNYLIYTYVSQNKNIEIFISDLLLYENKELKCKILYLKTENITKVSDSARYKMLGNGWTVDVIAHIFSHL